jgi:hypothetical protein
MPFPPKIKWAWDLLGHLAEVKTRATVLVILIFVVTAVAAGIWKVLGIGPGILFFLSVAGILVGVVMLWPSGNTRQDVVLDAGPSILEPAEPPGFFADEADRMRERRDLGLRSLGPLEVGLDLSGAPSGTYFLVRSPHPVATIRAEPKFFLRSMEMRRYNSGDLFAVAYTTATAKRDAEDPDFEGEVLAFFVPWAEHSSRASIPMARVSGIFSRDFAEGELLKVLLADPPPSGGIYA